MRGPTYPERISGTQDSGGQFFGGPSWGGAILSGTDLRETDMKGADLSDTTGIAKEQIDSAVIDENTRFPSYIWKDMELKDPPRSQ
ncbi:pentapeptide repeat-containing protein [Nitrospinota bacterium]